MGQVQQDPGFIIMHKQKDMTFQSYHLVIPAWLISKIKARSGQDDHDKI